jgi:hypothetical protein
MVSSVTGTGNVKTWWDERSDGLQAMIFYAGFIIVLLLCAWRGATISDNRAPGPVPDDMPSPCSYATGC